MFAFPKEPLGIGQILDRGFKLVRSVYASSLGVIGIMAIVGVLGAFAGVGMEQFSGEEADFSVIPMSFWGGLILFGLINVYLYFLLIFRICFAAFGRGDMLDSMLFSFRKLLPAIFMYFLYILAIMVGFVLLLVPGMILMISLSLCFYIMAIEDLGPIDSLKRSHELVWGNWWRTTIVFTVSGIIVMVFFLLVGILVGVLAATGGDENLVFANALIGFLQPLVYPILFSFGLVIYNDLIIRKEGTDLEQQIGDL